MYDFLEGTVAGRSPGQVVLAVQGVGWLLQVTPSCSAGAEEGAHLRLPVHLAVSDHALNLFGFANELERALFRRLIQVSGIGPQSALAILGSLPPEAMMRAILDGDTAALTRLKGVGKKTAERLVVELKDHLNDLLPAAAPALSEEAASSGPLADLVKVLTELGHPEGHARRQAEHALESLGDEADFQDLLRYALRQQT